MSAKGKEERKLDPRVKRTRQLLQQALTDLMAEKSFQAITVQDIAQRATVNRVTFYAHFDGKFALLEYSIRALFQRRVRSELPEGAPFSRQNLERLILLVCETLDEMAGHCPPPRTQFEPLMEKQIKAELCEILGAWLAEMPTGRSRRRPTPEQAAMITSWAIYGAAVHWTQKERPEPAREFARRVLPSILASLQPSGSLSIA